MLTMVTSCLSSRSIGSRASRPAIGQKLKTELQAKHVRVVALDLPTSWLMAAKADEFTGRMFEAINGMLLDMLAAVARKDYDDRRRRQAQGQAKAKADGRYKGRHRGRCAQRRHCLHAEGRPELERHTGGYRLQSRNHCKDRQAAGKGRLRASGSTALSTA